MKIRERTEEFELKHLSAYAMKSIESKGRARQEEKCPLRTDFQRDRDRILHSKTFRRLKHKTQVFFSPDNDHYRTRMTHTLEVSQIARTISRSLLLNEDLTEAIALGHDLGHTPFGHAGERFLNTKIEGGFRHNEQSLRVVTKLEKLNLTQEVSDGIFTHSWGLVPITLEGQVVQLADKIAYLNHDIEDAIQARLIKECDLPIDCREYFSTSRKQRLSKMIIDIVENSFEKDKVSMSKQCWFHMTKLRNWMFENVYLTSAAKSEEKKVEQILSLLFDHYFEMISSKSDQSETVLKRAVCDYISGMTDRFAIAKFKELFIPKSIRTEQNDLKIFKLIGVDAKYAKQLF